MGTTHSREAHDPKQRRWCLVLAIAIVGWCADARAGAIAKDLERAMAARGTHADTPVIIRFADAVDPAPLAVTDRRLRDTRLERALRERGARHLSAVQPFLAAQEAVRVKHLWLIGAVAATLPAAAVRELAMLPGVERVELDALVQGARSQRVPARHVARREAARDAVLDAAPQVAATPAAAVAGWNVAAVHAPGLWARGHTGHGIVVATMDTGADLDHPALRRKWRGGTNSWFDPHGEEPAPYDAAGHGTQALGVIVGDPSIGIAPDARWIAARLYDHDGRASLSDIHLAFQWMLDPDGDPATADAPDVLNASWALSGGVAGTCTLEFSDDIRMLRSAGIAVVFAAGNDGPRPGTSSSPANNPGVLSVGAVDRDLTIARQASRGPSACDGSAFPRVLAPGVGVRTADLSHGGLASYTTASGSSLAAPHAAGVLALLAGAYPGASVDELEAALVRGARAGDGLIDATAAFELLRPSTLSARRQ